MRYRNNPEILRRLEQEIKSGLATSYEEYLKECEKRGIAPALCKCGQEVTNNCVTCGTVYCPKCAPYCHGKTLVNGQKTKCRKLTCCSDECHNCDKIKCEDRRCNLHIELEQCNVCQENICDADACSVQCEKCESLVCNTKGEEGCSVDCSNCNDTNCKECLVDCSYCGEKGCPNQQCACASGCGICANCQDEKEECSNCKEEYCKDCIKTCPDCEEKFCSVDASNNCLVEHLSECNECKADVCQETIRDCQVCDETDLCESCLKKHKHKRDEVAEQEPTKKTPQVGDRIVHPQTRVGGTILKVKMDPSVRFIVEWDDETASVITWNELGQSRRKRFYF